MKSDKILGSHSDSEEYICPMHPEVVKPGPGSCPKCGMALEPKYLQAKGHNDNEYLSMRNRFYFSLIFALPLFFIAMFEWIFPKNFILYVPYLEFILATPVVFFIGYPIIKFFFGSIKHKSLNMFTLIGLGILTAYFFSLIALLFPNFFPPNYQHSLTKKPSLYFEISAMIMTLVLFGQALEIKARNKTGTAIQALLNLSPKNAIRINSNGVEEEVPICHLQTGDKVRVKPGGQIPVDGVVIEGKSSVDESMITGESVPVFKEKDYNVIGGTINEKGSLTIEVQKVGKDSMLSQIVQMVSDAQRSKAPIQKYADKISAYFVPCVLFIAILTAIFWGIFGPVPRYSYALVNAIAVLIIACPCALGLATPISIVIAMGRAAQGGILFKNAEAIELLKKIDVLVVDKTGTLTEGKPKLLNIFPEDQVTKNDLLQIAASIEHKSEHPLANAIISAAREQHISLQKIRDFEAITGKGAKAFINNDKILIGNMALMKDSGLDLSHIENQSLQIEKESRTVLYVAKNNQYLGMLSISDPIKSTTPSAIKKIKDLKIKIIMLTGDNPHIAKSVAEKIGISDFRANVFPAQKFDVIKELQNRYKVAMAGDGINDAPALTQADVGIAMGKGADVAIKSADITLIKGDLNHIISAYEISRKTMKNIKQNLFFAFIYNGLSIPIAAGVLYPFFGILLNPMIGALAMSLSSVSVILNSLRLKIV